MLTRTWLVPGLPPLSRPAEPHPNARLGYQPRSYTFVCPTCGEAWAACIVDREPQLFDPVRAECPRHHPLGLRPVWIDLQPDYNAHLPLELYAEYFLSELDWARRCNHPLTRSTNNVSANA